MSLLSRFRMCNRSLLYLNYNCLRMTTIAAYEMGNVITELPAKQNIGPISYFHTCVVRSNQSRVIQVPVKSGVGETVLSFMDNRLGITFGKQHKGKDLDEASHTLLNSIYMKADFNAIQKAAKLEDSFQSWLHIVYLHIWMLFVTLKRHDRDGKIMIKVITSLLWQDVEARAKKIEDELEQRLSINKQLKDYVGLLQTTFLLYDQGLLKSDSLLAGAVWTQIYSGDKKVDPRSIEALVHYIRYTLARLEEIPLESFVLDADNFGWPLPAKFGLYD